MFLENPRVLSREQALCHGYLHAEVVSLALKLQVSLSLLPRKSTFTRSLTTSYMAKKTSK